MLFLPPALCLTLFESEKQIQKKQDSRPSRGSRAEIPEAHLETWGAGGIANEVRMPPGISHLTPSLLPRRRLGSRAGMSIWGHLEQASPVRGLKVLCPWP